MVALAYNWSGVPHTIHNNNSDDDDDDNTNNRSGLHTEIHARGGGQTMNRWVFFVAAI